MSDHISPMHPRVAEAWLQKMEPMMSYQREALETVARLSPEYRSDIVDPDTNNGAYEVRTMVRHVTQWEEAT